MGWDHGLSFLWRFCSYGTLGTGLPPRSHPSRRTSPSRRRSVCFDTPTSRATSSALRPASSCLSAPIICASLCWLFDIPSSPFLRPKSYSPLFGKRGSGQELNPTVAEIFEESRARLPQEGGTLHPAPANGRAPQEIQTL